jgi:hypothetical protein
MKVIYSEVKVEEIIKDYFQDDNAKSTPSPSPVMLGYQ